MGTHTLRFNTDFLNTYYVPVTLLGPGNRAVNKRDSKFCLWGACILVGKNRQEIKRISKYTHTHTHTIQQQEEFSVNKNPPRKVPTMPVKGQQGGCPVAKLDSSGRL